MPNNATRTYRRAAQELKDLYGVVTFKRPRRCPGCGHPSTRINPDGACHACEIQKVQVTTPPTLIKRRAVVQIYSPIVFSFGVMTGRSN